MMLIPVLDLMRGRAVGAREGDRARYRPLESVLAPGHVGDALALARAYRDALEARECYVADLDAIERREANSAMLCDVATAAAPCSLMVDAGIANAEAAREALGTGAARVVVGLETLRSFEDLASIVLAVGAARAVFSLDLRLGRPVLHPAAGIPLQPASEIAARAVAAGATTLLLLDVGRVGTAGGVDVGLLDTLRRRFPSERLLVGGGVADRRDLERIRDAGCDGVLLATALHTGRIAAADLAAFTGPEIGQSSASASR